MNLLILLISIEIASAGVMILFGKKPKVTHHAHATSSHAVIIMPGISNVGDIAAKTVVPKLLDKNTHVLVVNYAWAKIDTHDIYAAIKHTIKSNNRNPQAAKIRSLSILGSSFGGAVAAKVAEHSLADNLPFGKIGLTLDGSIYAGDNLCWPHWLLQYGGYAIGGIFTTLLKVIPSYLNSSRVLDDVEPGLSMSQLRWHHLSIGLFPMPGLAAQIRFIRDFTPSPNLPDAISKAVFVCTPNDPLINNKGAVPYWRQAIPDIQIVTAAWRAEKHAPFAEQPTLQAEYAAMTFP